MVAYEQVRNIPEWERFRKSDLFLAEHDVQLQRQHADVGSEFRDRVKGPFITALETQMADHEATAGGGLEGSREQPQLFVGVQFYCRVKRGCSDSVPLFADERKRQ